jgi:hypothetical protein
VCAVIDVETPRSPGWWLVQLEKRLRARRIGELVSGLSARTDLSLMAPDPLAAHRAWENARYRRHRPGLDLLNDYLRGEPPLPTVTDSWREAMRPFIRQARTNLAELAVSSVVERMIPLGWATAAQDDRDGDEIAAQVALVNDFASVVPETFEYALALADAYMVVGEMPGRDIPLVTAEDPREVITAHDPATGKVLAGLKLYRDEWTDRNRAHLFLPGGVVVVFDRGTGTGDDDWSLDEAASATIPALAGTDLCPIVRFKNRRGVGEYEPHLDLLNRIDDTVFQRIAIGKYQAFRQRAAMGLPMETEDGDEIDYSEIFTADPGAMWQLPEGATMWESGVVDLTGVRMAIKDDVIAFAAVTKTPLHYLTPDAAAGSAEGASMMREGLVYRVEDRRRRFEGPLAQVMSLCFRMMGDTQRADAMAIRTLWQPAERFSLSEKASAAAQAVTTLPNEAILTDVWQYSPSDLPRLKAARAEDLLFAPLEAAANAPTAPARGSVASASGQPNVPAPTPTGGTATAQTGA